MGAAIDDWQQDQRHGGREELAQEAIELIQDIESEIIQADGAAVDSLAG
jgi:hypothetical protein